MPVVGAAVSFEAKIGADSRIEEIHRGPGRQVRPARGAGAIEQCVTAPAVLAPVDLLARPLAPADQSGRRVRRLLRL